MKIAYIAHPIGGDIEGNLADLRRIIRKINLQHPDVVPFVPYYADIVSLDDNVTEERRHGIRNDAEILNRKIPDELWLTGDRVSIGMLAEIGIAESVGIAVVDKINQL